VARLLEEFHALQDRLKIRRCSKCANPHTAITHALAFTRSHDGVGLEIARQASAQRMGRL
jgi:hypothetical protein